VKEIKNTTIRLPRHFYRTRATVKKMENLEQSHEVLKADMNSMKEQVVAMMEALNAIKNKLESLNSMTEQGVPSYPLIFHKVE